MNKKGKQIIAVTMAIVAVMGTVSCFKFSTKAHSVINTSDVIKGEQMTKIKEDNIEEVEEVTVDEMKQELIGKGYDEEELEFLFVCEEIEKLNSEDNSDEEILLEIEKKADEFFEEQQSKLAVETGANLITEVAASAYNTWLCLTEAEKKLVVAYPSKALAVNASSSRATEMTITTFGINGLGDKSDGFRHALWNALMARDIGTKYAKKFADAHESGKTEADLAVVASDGFTEAEHTKMDLHNNEVGRSLVDEKENKKSLTDKELAIRTYGKLTNNPETGIYWLH